MPTANACGLPLPSPTNIFPLVDRSTDVRADVPLPIITPFAVKLVAPVPPLPTASVADNPAAVPDVFWFPALLTPGKSIFPVPSNETPPIFLAVARAVAVAALPVHDPDEPLALPVNAPINPVAVMLPVDGLYVQVPSDSKPIFPPSTSPPDVKTKALSSLVDSLSVIVTVVATAAVPDVF